MIDPEDSFGQLDEAATDDQPDSIQSSVKQTEANERRECTYTSSNSAVSSGSRRQNTAPQYVARCRFCRCKFQQHRIAVRHEGRCNVEPVAQCRYCGETHTRADNSDIHIKTCEAYEHAKKCLTNKSESDATDSLEQLFDREDAEQYAETARDRLRAAKRTAHERDVSLETRA